MILNEIRPYLVYTSPNYDPRRKDGYGLLVVFEASSYVTRQADTDLYENLLTGEYRYALSSRQMGKSSLSI